jgi:hypothetical protein
VTIDIMFPDEQVYERVKSSHVLTVEPIARYYRLPVDKVTVFAFDPVFTIKIVLDRLVSGGDLGDTDVAGGQQFAGMVDWEIPDVAREHSLTIDAAPPRI